MCRLLAYLGPEIPVGSLLLEPENSLINQALDPELHPLLQLAGWGFGAWSEHLLRPDEPLRYRRPMAAFYDDNAEGILPSLQASTLLAHVRAAGYDAGAVLADENCHPFSFEGTPWILAQNGALPNWQLLQRELLQYCKDDYLQQMRGNTDTEFLFVLLISLLQGDSDDDVRRGFEQMLGVIVDAQRKLGLTALTKLKMALVAKHRVIGVNFGTGHDGDTHPAGEWRELRQAGPSTDEHAMSMLLEPMYLMTGRNFQQYEGSYGVDVTPVAEATSAIFASEPLTDDVSDWTEIDFGQIVLLERDGDRISKTVRELTS